LNETGIERNWGKGVLSGKWRKQILEAHVAQSTTAHKNHIDLNLERYLERYIHFCLQSDRSVIATHLHLFRALSRKQYDFVIRQIKKLLSEKEEGTTIRHVLSRTKEESRAGIDDEVWNVAEYLVTEHIRRNVLPRDVQNSTTYQAKSEAMFRILDSLVPHSRDMMQLVERRRDEVVTFNEDDVNTLLDPSGQYLKDSQNLEWDGRHGIEFRRMFNNREISALYNRICQRVQRGDRLSRAEKLLKKNIHQYLRDRNDNNLRRRKKQKWTFDLCPQKVYRPNYIQISSCVLKEMVQNLSKSHPSIKEALEQVTQEIQEDNAHFERLGINEESDIAKWVTDNRYWSKFFNLKKVLHSAYLHPHNFLSDQAPNKRFGNSIKTDGVGMSASLQRKVIGKEEDMCDLKEEIRKLNKFIKDNTRKNSRPQVQRLKSLQDEKKVGCFINKNLCLYISIHFGK
jgi:hypothetical protein